MPVLPRRWVLLQRERVSGTVDGGGRNGSLIAQVNTRICVLGSLEKRIIRMEGTRVIAILSFFHSIFYCWSTPTVPYYVRYEWNVVAAGLFCSVFAARTVTEVYCLRE